MRAEARDRKRQGKKTMTEETKPVLGTADILEIMKLLPHRYPFLLVDKIIEIDGDNSAIGIKNVTANEPHFTGHFPDQPIMPGVLLVEAHGADRRRDLRPQGTARAPTSSTS